MIDLPVHDLALFAGAALLLNLTPGADMLFVAGTGAARGRRAGVLAALGVGAGCALHTVLAALGLSALVAASDLAFNLVRWAGALYLVWLGIGLLRARRGPMVEQTKPGDPFWQGALTNALNPKVALFFLAFLPQFIEPGAPGQAWALVLLGSLFNLGGTAVNLVVALAAARVARAMATPGSAGSLGAWLQRACGLLFVGLGLRLAFTPR